MPSTFPISDAWVEPRAWITLVIAAVALLQPYAIWLVRKYLWVGGIEFHAHTRLELAYGYYGPMLNLTGTFRARDRDVFVSSVALSVVRTKDGATHSFEWTAFLPTGQPMGTTSNDARFEIAGGFMLLQQSPSRMRIVFSDKGTLSEMENASSVLRDAWQTCLEQTYNKAAADLDQDPYQENLYEHLSRTAFDEFRKSEEITTAYESLRTLNYWQPGQYLLCVKINTRDPQKSISQSYDFELHRQDSVSLERNVFQLLRSICDQPAANLHFAYPELRSRA